MTAQGRKGERRAPGWRFSEADKEWRCDAHLSASCERCPRPAFPADAPEGAAWWIDPKGVVMPEPTLADLFPQPIVVLKPDPPSNGKAGMGTVELGIDMRSRELANITPALIDFCDGAGDGLLNVFVSHATAGLAIVELGHGTDDDLVDLLERLAPQEAMYCNNCGNGTEGSDHLLPVLLSPSLVIPVVDGVVQLGGSQRVVLVDRFFPMHRRVRLSMLAA